jgi:hypothetical protein
MMAAAVIPAIAATGKGLSAGAGLSVNQASVAVGHVEVGVGVIHLEVAVGYESPTFARQTRKSKTWSMRR